MAGGKKDNGFRAIIKLALFMIYISVLCYVLFFAENLGRAPGDHELAYNMVPFNEIMRYIRNYRRIGAFHVVINLLGNVLLFFPFGFLLPTFWPPGEKNHPFMMFATALSFSSVVEHLQYVTSVGSADIDDVILNTTGALLGYFAYQLRLKLHS